ncbi:MAG TPA: 16S rRNA (guanine(966)-N(2))-methyltransferase RsmD [Humidesulfovibrio sp.]|uniref:16S rRNA (guanine(966)-N(2))-methyltransferase RsmD n=1 Tax=Humidesulfovibrio sp. TaxID=2910988 RepID=UPI002C190838|nr:16S rRNA (guanine(966)-N(2))-methyltransferase RsmD [Humidesulfovibrio sp.]HWR02523.1 16S rRNA (guanine(966)-N(2))-methyltransferase RsmD [Humidesulfovibrio sp.]
MRIIAGEYGGRSIRTVEGPGYRPATAKVRQAVFSMLEARGLSWEGARVLDLFAGSGSLAMEALSRGAAEAWLMDKNPRAVAAIKASLADLRVAPARFRVLNADLLKALEKRAPAPFDLVFVDPPYGLDLLPPAMEKAVRGGWIADGGLVLAEVEARCDFSGRIPAQLIPQADRLYGQTRILLWRNSIQDSPSTPEPSTP